MDDKQGSYQKPAKHTPNKIKDLYNAYVRNEGSRNIPINTPESQKSENETQAPLSIDLDTQTIDPQSLPEDMILVKREDLDNLIKRNEELEPENADLKDQILRKTAEMENFRRRTLLEKQQMLDYGNERLLGKFLDVIDDFSNAIEAGNKSNDYDSLMTGLQMIHQKVIKFMTENGVVQMENSAGKPFDVNFHEAVMMMPSELPEGHIVQEVQTGYMIQDKVLRHAKVITSSGLPGDN